MKKILVALMAVLVLASCGESKKETTPADVMMMTVEVMNKATENFDKAATADEVIDAMAAVGELLPSSLRETGRGGVAASPTGIQFRKEYFGK